MTSLPEIVVRVDEATTRKWRFVVSVGAGEPHTVTLARAYHKRLANGRTPEQLVHDSFVFLLAHEPQERILSSFDLSDIQRYFPDYENAISRSSESV